MCLHTDTCSATENLLPLNHTGRFAVSVENMLNGRFFPVFPVARTRFTDADPCKFSLKKQRSSIIVEVSTSSVLHALDLKKKNKL